MSHRRRAAVTGTLAALLSSAVIAAPGAGAAPTAPIACPDAFPTASAVDGLTGTGFTVEKGTTPEPFTVTLLGRIDDGIAPGIDMIMAEASSPALTRSKGIWAGMSGSPVYTDDGKLIGSVSYGLAANSPIAGITPAVEMKKLLSAGVTAPPAAKVAVGSRQAARIARTGKVTKAAAAQGFQRLKVPVTLSGVDAKHRAAAEKRLGKRIPGALFTSGGAARGAAAPADEIKAGGNFAAAASYGAATVGGVGTTTFVCDGQAVAFGHPFLQTGASNQFSAHPATALFVQPDPLFGPFKVANFGGVAGTVTQDRTAGLKAVLGQAPTTTTFTSRLGAPGRPKRVLRTQAVAQGLLPDLFFNHALATFDTTFDEIGPGSAHVVLKIAGTADGKAFSYRKSDHLADGADISGATGSWAATQVDAIVNQPLAKVKITSVSLDGVISPQITQFRIVKVTVKQGSKWVSGANGVVAKAGSSLAVRAQVSPYKSTATRTLGFTVPVPAGARGAAGTLDVIGGGGFVGAEPRTFAQLLAQLQAEPGGDTITGLLDLQTESGRAFSSSGGLTLSASVAPSDTLIDVVVN